MLQVGIVGCGAIGSRYDERAHHGVYPAVYTHAGMVSSHPNLNLAALCDIDSQARNRAAAWWSVPRIFEDLDTMLKHEALDMVTIATPDETHSCLIEAIAKHPNRPRLIFTEKPLAQTASEAERLLSVCTAAGIVLVVDYVRRWDQRHGQARQALAGNSYGGLVSATGYYVRGLRHNGCHLIHMLSWLTNSKIVEARALTARYSDTDKEEDRSLDIRLSLDNGAVATFIGLDRGGYGYSIFELDLFCASGRIRIDDRGQRVTEFLAATDETFSGFRHLKENPAADSSVTYGDALRYAAEDVVHCLTAELKTHPSSVQAVNDLRVVEAVFESARIGGHPVPVQFFTR